MFKSRLVLQLSITALLATGHGMVMANAEADHGHSAPAHGDTHAATADSHQADHGHGASNEHKTDSHQAASHGSADSHQADTHAPSSHSADAHNAAKAESAQDHATDAKHEQPAEAKAGGNRLEDNPDAIERIRKILQAGIPEKATVKVTVPAGNDHQAESHATNPEKHGASLSSSPKATHAALSNTHDVKKSLKPADKKAKNHETHNGHWTYEGPTGPLFWSELSNDYGTCDQGKMQSPIHITSNDSIELDLDPIVFNYGQLAGNIVNNGHTIQVNVEGDNNIELRGQTYKLLQFHFHHPAEERIDNHTYPMVMHMVHKSESGQLAVIGVLIEPGKDNPVVNHLWSRLPFLEQQSNPLSANVFDLGSLLPQEHGYYTFTGSLTTPPCSENVLWVILQKPISLSEGQIKTFGRLYPHNARPLQATNKRLIQASKTH